MAMSTKLKKRTAVSVVESSTHCDRNQRVPAPVHNVQFTNCQFGNQNIQVQASSDTKYDKKDDTQKSKDTKIHTGVLILKSILEGYKKALLYSDLEEDLSKYMQSEKLESFQHITGWSLNEFLTLKKDRFDVYTRKQKKYVRYRNKISRKVKSHIKTCGSENEAEDEQLQDGTNMEYLDSSLDSEEPRNDTDTGQTWTEVVHGKKKKQRFNSKNTFPVNGTFKTSVSFYSLVSVKTNSKTGLQTDFSP